MRKPSLLFLLFLCIVGFYLYRNYQNYHPVNITFNTISTTPNMARQVLGQRVKSANCSIRDGMEDADCTPGAVIAGVTKDQICVSGYSTSVRNVPLEEKQAVYAEYGITYHHAGEYEVDHLISLELGGSNDIANLWPEAANPIPGFHQKDVVENYLHEQVCYHDMPLSDAQYKIVHDWKKIYATTPQ